MSTSSPLARAEHTTSCPWLSAALCRPGVASEGQKLGAKGEFHPRAMSLGAHGGTLAIAFGPKAGTSAKAARLTGEEGVSCRRLAPQPCLRASAGA